MTNISLACVRCEAEHPADMHSLRCKECEYPLEVRYREWTADSPGVQPLNWEGPPIPIPVRNVESLVYMGEGNTPCVELPTVAGLMDMRQLWAKLEFMNPTGSFKDRGTSMMMSMAKEFGIGEIVEDSSGNAGASVSAYAARAGIKAHIFAPESAPEAKIQQIKVYGAEAHSISGTRDDVTQAAIDYYTERGSVYASHNLSPYFIEGTKTFAYELLTQFPRNLPKHIVIPVGNGSLYIGAWKGFNELRQAGHVFDIPRLHCIQSRAVMPIAAAYNGEEWNPDLGARTIAGGISVGSPPHKDQILEILRDSNGIALAVDDDEIVRWQKLLAEREGIYCEPTSAAAFAGLDELVRRGEINRDESVLVPVTGFGLKDAPPL